MANWKRIFSPRQWRKPKESTKPVETPIEIRPELAPRRQNGGSTREQQRAAVFAAEQRRREATERLVQETRKLAQLTNTHLLIGAKQSKPFLEWCTRNNTTPEKALIHFRTQLDKPQSPYWNRMSEWHIGKRIEIFPRKGTDEAHFQQEGRWMVETLTALGPKKLEQKIRHATINNPKFVTACRAAWSHQHADKPMPETFPATEFGRLWGGLNAFAEKPKNSEQTEYLKEIKTIWGDTALTPEQRIQKEAEWIANQFAAHMHKPRPAAP